MELMKDHDLFDSIQKLLFLKIYMLSYLITSTFSQTRTHSKVLSTAFPKKF